jgi:hypothetical protein
MRAVAPNEERAVAQLRQLKKLLDDGIISQQVCKTAIVFLLSFWQWGKNNDQGFFLDTSGIRGAASAAPNVSDRGK